MKCKLTYIIAILLSFALMTSCTLAENDYYVSSDGDDSNPGNAKAPWKTISYGVSQVKSGTLHIGAGVYEEAVNLNLSGTPENPIVILGEEGAIIDGSFGYNFPGKGLFTIENASYIQVEGITVRNVQTHGIVVQGHCSHIQIRN